MAAFPARRDYLDSAAALGACGQAGGLWTIGLHPNSAGYAQFAELRTFLRNHADQFTSVDRELAEFEPSGLSPAERACEGRPLWSVRASGVRKHLRNYWPRRS